MYVYVYNQLQSQLTGSDSQLLLTRKSFYFSFFLSIVIHKNFCAKYFSGTIAPRIMKFGTNIGYNSLFCGKYCPAPAYFHLFVHFWPQQGVLVSTCSLQYSILDNYGRFHFRLD